MQVVRRVLTRERVAKRRKSACSLCGDGERRKREDSSGNEETMERNSRSEEKRMV